MSAPTPIVARVLSERRRAWLARPKSHVVLALLSVLLCTSSIGIGWQLDDHVHHVLVRGGDGSHAMWTEPPHPLDLFRFVDGDEADWRHGLETGVAPWYTSERVRLAFARPLASLTHVFDYTVLEHAPWAMHLHSLLWLFVLGWAVARLVRRVEDGWIAGLVILFYVLDAGHGVPAGWLSNRNPLLAGAFGALGLEAHIRHRRGELKTPLASLALCALGLLAGETMIGWLGFFAAFALTLDPRGWRRGLVALWPLGLLVIAWRIGYRALGYGASGSALYVDPLRDPLHFARVLVERLPQLLGGQLGGPPAGFLSLAGRDTELVAIGLAMLVVVGLGAALVPLLRRDPRARFWGLGALLATIPVCATQPHPRLMLVAGLGVAGVIGRYLAGVVEAPPSARFPRVLAAFWLLSLGLVSPLRLPFEAYSAALVGRPNRLATDSIPADAEGETLVVLTVPDPMFMCAQVPLALASLDRPRPARLRCVASVETRAEITREDAHTLVVRAPDGLLSGYFVPLLRDHDDPLEPGWSLTLSDVRMEIAERAPDGGPLALRLRFVAPLEDPSLHFVVWSPTEEGFVPFSLPAEGETTTVRGQPITELFMGG